MDSLPLAACFLLVHFAIFNHSEHTAFRFLNYMIIFKIKKYEDKLTLTFIVVLRYMYMAEEEVKML